MKKIVITGASKGIGKAIAIKFASNSYKVLITARNEEQLVETKEEIVHEFPSAQVDYQVADSSDSTDMKRLAHYISNDFGGCDILVNNAGVFIPGSVYNEEESNLSLMMDTNLKGAYELTRALVPSMISHKSGDIVNICSIASNTAYPNGGSYSISKFALLGFSKNLREEMKPFGIRVMAILPGAVYTDSWSGSNVDPNRLMPPSDIADMVFASCSLSRRSVVEEMIIRPQLGDL